ncbi:MAG: hypothetical protein ACOCU4_06380 [Alkalispirochaeta sp.]
MIIRFRADDEEYDTRLAFLLDGRRAPRPQIATRFRSDRVSLYSLAQTELQWATVASQGARQYSDPVLGRVTLDLTDIPASAEEILIRARFPHGPWTQTTADVSGFRSPEFQLPREIVDDGVTIAVGSPGETGELTLLEASSGRESLHFRGEYPLRWRPPAGFSATLMSEGDHDATVRADRSPLAPPVVTFRDDRLVLAGEGQMFYRVDGAPETMYETPVELSGVAGALRRYRIDAYRILEGQISPTITVYPVIDERQPVVPPPRVAGAVAQGSAEFVSRDASPTVTFSSPYEDLQLHYEVSSTGEALLPQTESPLVGDGIILTAPEGEETRWRIRVRGRFPGRAQWSPVYRMAVTIDRQPPPPPVLSSDPRITGVVAFEPPRDSDTTVWYRLRESEPYRRYEAPVTIDRDRLERAIVIGAYTRDGAGNRTELPEAPLVEPLNDEPAPPQLMMNGRPADRPRIVVSRESLLEVLDPTDVRWRILDGDGSSESRRFEPIREPRLLTPGTYRINAFRERGSERSRVIERIITIDPERPQRPAVPYISYASDGRSGTVYWPGAQSERIFASVVPNFEAESVVEPFSVSDGTVQWQIPDDSSYVTLAYFSLGESGQRSETEVLRIDAARLRPPAELSGVRNGERYRSERTVRLSGRGDIRFTVTSDGSSPQAVRVSSPRYEAPLLMSAAAGETTHYRLRYQTFQGDSPVSEEREISFVIDREPPGSPVLVGAEPDGYYSERRVVRLRGEADSDTIFYRVSADESLQTDFSRYGDERVLLEEEPAAPRRYRIDAYSVDSVGNRSPGIATWTITVDATSLHVSAVRGDDHSGDGSRQAPLATLDAALRRVTETSRDTIFLTSGTYTVSAAALADQPDNETRLNLIGGFDPVTWRPGSDRSIINAPEEGIPPLQGTLRLERLSFSQTLHLRAERMELRNVHVHVHRHMPVNAGGTPGIIQTGGIVSVRDSSIVPSIEIQEGAVFDARGSALGSVSIHGAVATVTDSISNGLRVHDGSRVVVSESRISADRTVDIGGLVYADESALEINSSLIQSAGEDPILVRGRDTDVRIHGTLLYGTGQRSAVAIRTRGGRLTVIDSMVDVRSQGFAYGLFARNTPIELSGSAVDGIAIAASDGALSLNSSILWVSSEEGEEPITATGVSADGQGVDALEIRDSTILAHRVHDAASTAIRLGSPGIPRIRDNAFTGWPFSLIQSTSAVVWERSGRLPSVDDLNQSPVGSGNLRGPTLVPPARRTPTVPHSSIAAELRELLDGYSQNHSGPAEP